MATTERHDFQLWAAGFTQSDIILNDLLNQLETKLGLSVTSRVIAAQPGSPTAGECYILPSTPTGTDWAAWNQNDIVIFQQGTWVRFVPIAGWPAWDEATSEGLMFSGSAWIVVNQDLSAYMIQATFDADFAIEGLMYADDGAGAYSVLKTNFTAIIDPTVDDDITLGYTKFSPWINTVGVGEGATLWFCLDNTDGAAVWKQMGSGGGGGGLTVEFKTASFTAEPGKKYKVDTTSAAVVVTLPAGTDLDNIVIQDTGHNAFNNNITINPDGTETIDDDTAFVIDQNEGQVDIGYDNANTNWRVAAFGTPDLVNADDYFTKYRGQNLQTGTSYELVWDDAGKVVEMNNGSANTLTIPANSAVAFPVDTRIDVIQYGAGATTIAITTDTLTGTATIGGQYQMVSLWKRAATEWVVIGGS